MPARVALVVVHHRANHIYIITLGEVSTHVEPSIPDSQAVVVVVVAAAGVVVVVVAVTAAVILVLVLVLLPLRL